MDLIERLQDFDKSCSQLFDQVDERISFLNHAIDNMRERISNVRERITGLTSDHNKATRLYSPSSYPSYFDSELKLDPVYFTIYNSIKLEISDHGGGVDHDSSDNQLSTKESLDQVNEITLPMAKSKPRGTILDPFKGIRSVSSLLVYHTHENRLIHNNRMNRKDKKSKTSDSSLHDYAAARSNKFIKATSSLYHDKNIVNKSSSGGESEQNLGPVPESILKYHQESLIEPDILDNINILDYQDDDSNPLTGELPDILPSLPGIVRDIDMIRTNEFPKYERNVNSSFITEQLNSPDQSCDDTKSDHQNLFFSNQPDVNLNLSLSPPHPPPPPPPPPFTGIHPLPSVVGSHQIRPSSSELSSDFKSQEAITIDQITLSQKIGFLDQFKHLFFPIDSLPLPESSTTNIKSAESRSHPQEKQYVE